MDSAKVKELEEKCAEIRYLIVDTIGTTGSGHVGGSLSAVEAVVTLYYHQMNVDPTDPNKPGRDRFVLSKGHSGPVLYAVLADKGYFDKSWLLPHREYPAAAVHPRPLLRPPRHAACARRGYVHRLPGPGD